MPEKLLTVAELAEYLGVKEEKIHEFVDNKAISAYRIGGELLRFRKEQIDAMRAELDSRITDEDRVVVSEARKMVKERHQGAGTSAPANSFSDKIADFLHFNDFYIVSAVLIVILVVVIFRG
ncbi:MAG: helix-turn-helix domain-containing protein [Candidatus Tantalella remota]|nr:helix-turn-helix domain-containing protein [Candidatus Tantalella remota]